MNVRRWTAVPGAHVPQRTVGMSCFADFITFGRVIPEDETAGYPGQARILTTWTTRITLTLRCFAGQEVPELRSMILVSHLSDAEEALSFEEKV
jgi:hypothetical protein